MGSSKRRAESSGRIVPRPMVSETLVLIVLTVMNDVVER